MYMDLSEHVGYASFDLVENYLKYGHFFNQELAEEIIMKLKINFLYRHVKIS